MANELYQHMANLTVQSIVKIAANQGISFDKQEMTEKLRAQAPARFKSIVEEMIRDGKEADLFGQLDHGKVGALSMQVAKVSLHHGCVMFAKELLNVQETANQ